MKPSTKIHASLAVEEYFKASDSVSKGQIEVRSLRVDHPVTSNCVYGFGPKILKNGKPSDQRRACVMLKFADLPETIAQQLRAVVPVVGDLVGSEAERQAALG